MNRIDFMNQLESLLQNIAPGEREEALQYYNCYFDDAGEENEQDVLEALGTPAKVAENIKRDLMENGGAEAARKVKASDRALVEYGKSVQNEEEEAQRASGAQPCAGGRSEKSDSGLHNSLNSCGSYIDNSCSAKSESGSAEPFGTHSQESRQEQFSGSGNNNETWMEYNRQDSYGCQGQSGYGMQEAQPACGQPGQPGKGLPGWAVALIVIAVVMLSPAAAGLVAGAFGILAGWIGMMVGFGVASVVLFLVMVFLVILGFLCFFVNPWAGCALMGGGLICGALGIVFLMLTVAMAGIVTPAVFRGIAGLFRRRRGAM